MISRQMTIQIAAVVVTVFVATSLISYQQLDAQNYIAYIQIDNRTPFEVTVYSAEAEIYDSSGMLIATAEMVNDTLHIPRFSSVVVAVHINLLISEEEVQAMDPNEVLVVKTTVTYELFGPRTFKGTETVKAETIINEVLA